MSSSNPCRKLRSTPNCITRGDTAAMMDCPAMRIVHARPDELHRLAHLLGDEDGLADEILKYSAPAEAAAEHRLVNDHLAVWHPCSIRGDGKRGLAVLSGRPDLDRIGGDVRCAILRLHGGMGEERHFVVGFDPPRGSGKRCGVIALTAPDARIVGAQPRAQGVAN